MSDYDGLWERDTAQLSWLDKVPAEQREWLEGLADLIIETGQEPVWRQVHRRFTEVFDEAPETTTLIKHVRSLVGKRG